VDASVEVAGADAVPSSCVDVEKLANKLKGLQYEAAAVAAPDVAQQRVKVVA
jgi:hypothetical protein